MNKDKIIKKAIDLAESQKKKQRRIMPSVILRDDQTWFDVNKLTVYVSNE